MLNIKYKQSSFGFEIARYHIELIVINDTIYIDVSDLTFR